MSTCTARAIATTPREMPPRLRVAKEPPRAPRRETEPLGRGVALLDLGRPTAADEVLTAALLDDPRDADLWLAAGIARLRRGALRSARAAFEMCAWLSDEPLARQLAAALGPEPPARPHPRAPLRRAERGGAERP